MQILATCFERSSGQVEGVRAEVEGVNPSLPMRGPEASSKRWYDELSRWRNFSIYDKILDRDKGLMWLLKGWNAVLVFSTTEVDVAISSLDLPNRSECMFLRVEG